MTAVAVQRSSAKSTTVPSASGVNLKSPPSAHHLDPYGGGPMHAAGRLLPVDVRLIHPYPTRESRRDAMRGISTWWGATPPGRTPIRGVAGAFVDPSVSADVLFSECGQPVFDAGDRSRAVLVVLFVAQQRGQCGGVGESLHRRRDFAHGQVVVIVDR